jgi:hypothetical protein
MWLLFATEAEAEAAQALIWDAVKPPAEIRDGKPLPDRVTERWAVPRLVAEGWAIAAPSAPVKGVGGKVVAAVTFPDIEEDQP